MMDTDWIGADLLRSILQAEPASRPHRIDNVRFTVEPGSRKGDNYASDIFRVVMEYSQDGKQMNCKRILKVVPSGEQRRVQMVQKTMFPREIAVYRDIMPMINDLLFGIGESIAISPKFTCTMENPKPFLVFEDIKEAGYEMVDRKLGLDLEHSRMVISKMAKLHACSAVAYQIKPPLMGPLLEGAICWNPDREEFLAYNKMCFQQIARLVQTWNDPLYNHFLENLQNLHHKFISKGIEVYTRNNSVFNILNHGDLWTSNVMFKYENGSVKDVLLLDYQLAYYGSPAVDLNYFLYGSVQEDVRKNSSLELIRLYRDVLKATLKKLKYEKKVPSVLDIHLEIVRRGFHRVNAVFCLVPITLMERTDSSEMAKLLHDSPAGEAFRNEIFSNPQLEPILKRALIDFYNLGYFDLDGKYETPS